MWQEVIAVFRDLRFWGVLGASMLCWYGLAVYCARSFFHNGSEPLAAARRGPWPALGITVFAAGVASWLLWNDLWLTGVATASGLLLMLLVILVLSFVDSSAG